METFCRNGPDFIELYKPFVKPRMEFLGSWEESGEEPRRAHSSLEYGGLQRSRPGVVRGGLVDSGWFVTSEAAPSGAVESPGMHRTWFRSLSQVRQSRDTNLGPSSL